MKSVGSVLVLLFVLVGCSHADRTQDRNQLPNKQQTNHADSNLVEYATHFRLYKRTEGFELLILNPDTQSIEKTYLLSASSEHQPSSGTFDVIRCPVEKLIALSSTQIGALSLLQETNRVVGVSGIDYVYSPTLRKQHAKSPIAEFPDLSTLNPERVVETGASLIVYSGFGSAPAQESKLQKLGITAIPDYDWRERHPLGKAEWIKVIGLLTGRFEEAVAHFNQVKTNYLRLQQRAEKKHQKPMILSGILIGDIWYLPARENYLAQLIHDAHARNVGDQTPGTASAMFNLQQILANSKDYDIWINPGFADSGTLLQQNRRYKFIRPFQEKRVFCYSHRMNFFWEYSALRPDKVLQDFIELFHNPTVSDEKLYFYKRL